ncbi:TPA: hypothetical protein ACTTVN_002484 [Legionella anisa]
MRFWNNDVLQTNSVGY